VNDAATGLGPEPGDLPDMPGGPSRANNLVSAFTTTVRQAGIPVDVQRMGLAFRMVLDSVAPGDPVPLDSIWEHFVHQQGLPERQIAELVLVLKNRFELLGVRSVLPSGLDQLSQDQHQSIVEAFNGRFQQAQAQQVQAAHSAQQAATAPAQKPAARGTSFQPKSKGDAASEARARRLAIGAVGALALGLAVFTIYQETQPPAHAAVQMPYDSSALSCVKTIGNRSLDALICHIPKSQYDEGEAAFQTRAQLSKASAVQLGFGRLFVFTAEDQKLRGRF
jgi:hypothetical protein